MITCEELRLMKSKGTILILPVDRPTSSGRSIQILQLLKGKAMTKAEVFDELKLNRTNWVLRKMEKAGKIIAFYSSEDKQIYYAVRE